ncbi:MAG TPA: hypothetical protein VFQ88_09630 [Nevskiaceae bacterium]|nr:hypothetical protein [Nevskiaceae bacterium]
MWISGPCAPVWSASEFDPQDVLQGAAPGDLDRGRDVQLAIDVDKYRLAAFCFGLIDEHLGF